MAIYHCTCKIISRSSGRSSIGASAYRSGTKMINQYDGITHNYTKKRGIMHSEVILCKNAPIEWKNREILWNEVERIEKTKNGQLAREFEVALPQELSLNKQIELVREYIYNNFINNGMCADFSIHDKRDGNPHAHIMLTTRPISKDGTWENKAQILYICKNDKQEEQSFTADELKKAKDDNWKKLYKYKNKNIVKWLTQEEKLEEQYKDFIRVSKTPKTEKYGKKNPIIEYWNSNEFLINSRDNWEKIINDYLIKNGINIKVDARSYKNQGKLQIPTKHLGVIATQMKKKGMKTYREDINCEIKKMNNELYCLLTEIKSLKIEYHELKINTQMQNICNVLDEYKILIEKSDIKHLHTIEENILLLKEKIRNTFKYIEKYKDVSYIEFYKKQFQNKYNNIYKLIKRKKILSKEMR